MSKRITTVTKYRDCIVLRACSRKHRTMLKFDDNCIENNVGSLASSKQTKASKGKSLSVTSALLGPCCSVQKRKKARKMILYQAKVMRLLTCVFLFILCQTTSWIVFAESTAEMCFQYNSHQIQILIPETADPQSFVIMFIPANGSQEPVTSCYWSDKTNSYTCNSPSGYNCEILENKRILINISDLQPGNFRLQMRQNNVHSICSWNPKVGAPQHQASSDRPNNVAVTNGSVHNPSPAEESSLTGIIVGSIVGFVSLIGIVISIYFYKKQGLPCHKKPNKSSSNSSSYYPRNSGALHSRGAYIEDISSSSQTNIPDRGRTRIYRTKMAVAVSCMEPDSTEKQDVMKQMSE